MGLGGVCLYNDEVKNKNKMSASSMRCQQIHAYLNY